jgi:hypothetical protein
MAVNFVRVSVSNPWSLLQDEVAGCAREIVTIELEDGTVMRTYDLSGNQIVSRAMKSGGKQMLLQEFSRAFAPEIKPKVGELINTYIDNSISWITLNDEKVKGDQWLVYVDSKRFV